MTAGSPPGAIRRAGNRKAPMLAAPCRLSAGPPVFLAKTNSMTRFVQLQTNGALLGLLYANFCDLSAMTAI